LRPAWPREEERKKGEDTAAWDLAVCEREERRGGESVRGGGGRNWASADWATRPRAGGSLSFFLFYFPNPFFKRVLGKTIKDINRNSKSQKYYSPT